MLRRDFDKTFSIDCGPVVHEHFVDGFVIGIMRRLTEAERWRAIGMLQTGSTQVQTANVMATLQSVLSRLLARYQRTKQWQICREVDVQGAQAVEMTVCLSIKRYVTGRLRRQIFNNTCAVFEGLQSPGKPSEIGFTLKARHHRARLARCTQRRRWNINRSRFALDFHDGRKRIWCRVGVIQTLLELPIIDMEKGLLWHGVEPP